MINNIPEFSSLPERLRGLAEIAENLWWSWHPSARMLFKALSRPLWKESGHNPDRVLRQIPGDMLEKAAGNPDFLRHYDLVLSRFRRSMQGRTCDILGKSADDLAPIAYFSTEYGLHHSLPFYAGGLGFLAGDFLKECSDLHLPMVAIGFMYPGGYVKQSIREDGWQEGLEQAFEREAASISRVLDATGEQLVIRVPLIDPPIHVGVWKVSVGRVPLYLMDTDIELNDPWNRAISARLYTSDTERRLRQEIVLGIGGSQVLAALGIQHSVLHLNEGHAGFAILERIRDRIQEGVTYADAVEQVRETTVFTTHTPVSAGHDVFPFPLIEKYFHDYWPSLGLDHDRFLQLGVHPKDAQSGFHMTAFALRMSGFRNAVSLRHGEVTRRMWQCLWPEIKDEHVPIEAITNGIHVPTWIEPKMELLFNRYLGPDWLEDHDNPLIWEMIDEIPDQELWQTHCWLKHKLINVIKEKARQRWAGNHMSASLVVTGGVMLDPTVLTIGFARRFVTYKRADLMLLDRERLMRLLNDPWSPVQIIFAGKAHPADDPGKMILQRIVQAARDPETGGRIAFVEDYGEQLAQYLVHGVDVWLNNPLPPMEACGTSGMKAALNGVPHLSILDGWWIEGYTGDNGWVFGRSDAEGDRNRSDAEAIYAMLEEDIIPRYYDVSEDGVPKAWVRIMKSAIKSCGPRFCTRRMVKEYAEKFYMQAFQKIRV